MAPLQPTMVSSSTADSVSVMDVDMDESKGVKNPAINDVLCGRGGNINTHPGNESFRQLIELHRRSYLTARFKKDKRLITDTIVQKISSRGGKFLSRDTKSGLWYQVPDEKARDKTSQALRENAPKLREAIEKENEGVRARQREEEERRKNEEYHQIYGSPLRHPGGDGHYNRYESHRRNQHDGSSNYHSYPNGQRCYDGWSPDRPNPPTQSDPHYNSSKSIAESIVEVFACPTSLDDVFFPSNSQSPQAQIQSNGVATYSGNKRSYHDSPRRNYQRRDDREHWNGNTHSKGSPVFYELPGGSDRRNLSQIPSRYSEQRFPKRVKGQHYGFSTSTYPQSPPSYQSSSNNNNTMSWNPFPSWNKPPPPPVDRSSTPLEEGQEVQLITRVESMSMDDHKNQEYHNYSSPSYSQVYHAEKEVRTPPPTDEPMKANDNPYPQNAKPQDLRNDWTSMGSCNIFLGDIFRMNEDEEAKPNDGGLRISPVPSIDLNGSIGSLEGNELTSGDLNGASLVNVFSDGDNDVKPLEKPAKGKRLASEESIFNISDLGGDIDVLSY